MLSAEPTLLNVMMLFIGCTPISQPIRSSDTKRLQKIDAHPRHSIFIQPPSKPLYEAFGSNYNQIGRPWCQTIGN